MDFIDTKAEFQGSNEKKWTANYFKEYLVALGRGKNFLVGLNEFPKRIELYPELTSVLNQISRHTRKDLHERWALLGFKADKTRLLTQSVPVKAMEDHVPAELIKEEIERAKKNAGIETIIGDIHSHPSGLMELYRGQSGTAAFSPVDIYKSVIKGGFMPVVGVADGNENLFVFRTRESYPYDIDPKIFNAESFEKYWFELNGFKYLGLDKHSKRAISLSPNASTWKTNVGIATRHRLALYKGFAGGDLVRQWPL